MTRMLIPVAALLLSDALLLTGHGLQATLLPVSAELHGFTTAQIGLMGSGYYLGFVTGCLLTPWLVRRTGHIRTFAILATSYSAVVLMFFALPYLPVWLGLRFIVGLAISGLYMTIESWLNERSTSSTRGTILSLYVVINMSMTMVGQQMLNLADPLGQTLFVLISILLSIAMIPVCLTTSLAPAPIQNVRIDVRKVWRLSQAGVAGAIATGLVTGAFWSLGPLYARGLGLETRALTLFLSAVVLGGAVFQLPLGRLSDRYDRRLVLLGTATVGAVLSALLAVLPGFFPASLSVLAFLWGGCVMTQYAISLAHANDRAAPEEFVMVGSVMLLSMGVFSALGSVIAAVFMQGFGPAGLYVFAALCLSIFALTLAARRRVHVLPVHDETGPFRAVADTATPMAFELDPRNEDAVTEKAGPPD
ncbi:MAG: MFS transporter [Pseudomonadales bacterium]|nr:MFS transporter [Pseudomonadales bacterium]